MYEVRDNNAFFVEILSTLKGIKSSIERSKACLINFI